MSGLKALARKVRTPDAEPQPAAQLIAPKAAFKQVCEAVEKLVASLSVDGKVEVDAEAGACYLRETDGHLCLWEIVLQDKREVTLAVYLPSVRKANDQGLTDAEVEAAMTVKVDALARMSMVLSKVVALKQAGWKH